MPPPSSRMTKNQDRTHRLRPGKATIREESEDETDSDVEAPPQPLPVAKPRRNPAATTLSIPKKLPPAPIARQPEIDLEGFVTASESSEDEAGVISENDETEGSDEESSEEESESESEEDTKPRLIAPKFISKAQRTKLQMSRPAKTDEETALEDETRRKEKATEMLQAQLERDQAARAAGRKAWDDDDNALEDDVDDTDGVDPEAEHAAWKLRELKRVKRDRLALVEKEKEREEIERRKGLTAEERDAEDRDFLEQQKADQDGRGKMAFMQKYYHKGAFFQGDEEQDEEVKAALTRDLAGARFVDETDKDTLPEYMRIRDMTQLGRKSRSKYKDLKAEDTGRFGDFREQRSRYDDGRDDGPSQTGANTAPLGIRRPRDEDDSHRDEKRARLA